MKRGERLTMRGGEKFTLDRGGKGGSRVRRENPNTGAGLSNPASRGGITHSTADKGKRGKGKKRKAFKAGGERGV